MAQAHQQEAWAHAKETQLHVKRAKTKQVCVTQTVLTAQQANARSTDVTKTRHHVRVTKQAAAESQQHRAEARCNFFDSL